MSKKTAVVDFKAVFTSLEQRSQKLFKLCDEQLVTLKRHFCAILSACDNSCNQHFAENALTLFTFVAYEFDALTMGRLPFEGQERFYKGFISKQCGSFDKDLKKDSNVRLTTCCVENLSNEARSDCDKLNQLDIIRRELISYTQKLQTLGDGIVSALSRKNRGKGYKFTFNVKYYGGYKYISECSTGDKVRTFSDGVALLKKAIDVDRRDLFAEISALSIAPLLCFPHDDIVAVENNVILVEKETLKAEQLAYQRRVADNLIIAKKREEEKKRKQDDRLRAAEAVVKTSNGSDFERKHWKGGNSTDKSGEQKSGGASQFFSSLAEVDGSDSEEDSDEEDDMGNDSVADYGFTLKDYKGGENDEPILRRFGRKKPSEMGDLDLRGAGYDEVDDDIVRALRNSDASTLKNFVLRGGQVVASELLPKGQKGHPSVGQSSRDDAEWNENHVVGNGGRDSKSGARKKSLLDDLDLDGCEGVTPSKKYVEKNFIDRNFSSDEDTQRSAREGRRSSAKAKKSRKAPENRKVKPTKPSRAKAKSLADDSDSSLEHTFLRSSSDSDAAPKRKRKTSKSADVTIIADQLEGSEDKPRKPRECVGLTEQQVVQYDNVNLIPCQMTAAQINSARHERFEVDGKFLSDDDIRSLILNDADIVNKNIDAKFLTFVRENIMVEVFKDVYFISNVIQFYRMKRFVHSTQPGDHLVCVWQEVLRQVATDLVGELVASNKKILEKMDSNLLQLRSFRKQKRHDASLVIGSDEDLARIAEDFNDLNDYREQMKLSKRALEEIEKVMKRRINSFAHSMGAKIACIWAKLNGFQHLLRGSMSKFEKKFLLDPSMPFYSVLSDDLSRRWGNVVVSPSSLFPGIDLAGRNDLSAGSSSLAAVETATVPTVSSKSYSAFLKDGGEDMDCDEDDTERQPSEDVDIDCSSYPLLSSSDINMEHSNVRLGGPIADDASPERVRFSGGLAVDGSTLSKLDVGSSRPFRKDGYVSAVFDDSGCAVSPSESHSIEGITSNDVTPSVRLEKPSASRGRGTGLFTVKSHFDQRVKSSFLTSISSLESSSSNSSPQVELCASNAAVLFDEMKNMSQDSRTVESMMRFIEVMNEKPANVLMPATVAEEEKILSKANAKKKKAAEESKKSAATEEANKAAAMLAKAVLPSDVSSLSDNDIYKGELHGFSAADLRQRTDSYSLLQKLFLFICKKHIEVKDATFNLQIFGQRLVRTLKNNVLLKFLLLLLRNKDKDVDVLVVYFLDEKDICSDFKCVFGVSYNANDYFNILGDGYCVLRSMFALFCNEQFGYQLSVADMKKADSVLFKSKRSRQSFFEFMSTTRVSVDSNCNDESMKVADKKKLRTLMLLFGTFPQLKQVPGAYWACLDWVAYAPFNCTAFSTNYGDNVPGYAQLHCSSSIRRDMPSSTIGMVPFSIAEINRVLTEPLAPNFCVLEGQHAFVVRNPPKEEGIKSFKAILGLFLGVCLQSVAELAAVYSGDFSDLEIVIDNMIADNAYSFNVAEVKLMTAILQTSEELTNKKVLPASDTIVLCSGEGVSPVVSHETFSGSRDVASDVIDLCDSDTGDMDRVKLRTATSRLPRHDQDFVEMKFKLEASERENKFLLRLIERDPKLMFDPPLEIDPE